MQKSMILEPRGSRNRPKWCQGALRKSPRRNGQRGIKNCEAFWLHLADFGRFLGPLEIRPGAKNGPKKTIRLLFGAPGRSKDEKNRFWKAFGKNAKI